MNQRLSLRQNVLQALKFTLFSLSAGIVQALSFTFLNEIAILPYWPAYLISLILSVVYNFTVNRRYTFKSVANIPVAMTKILLYYSIFTPISTLVGDKLVDGFGWNEYLVLAGTMVTNLVTEFMVYRLFVYRNAMNTNHLARSEQNTSVEA